MTPINNKKYTIIAGERRWRAANLAGIEQVPAIIRSAKQLEQLEIALIENVQRVDLSPLDQATSIARLHDQFNMDYIAIAKRLGKATTTVNNIVRLLQLPQVAQTALREQKISEGHARTILSLKNQNDQLVLLELIQKNHWSVRQTEQYVAAQKQGNKTPASVRQRLAVTTPATQKLSSTIKAPVAIKRTAHGGKLEITFTSDKDLTRIIEKLSSS